LYEYLWRTNGEYDKPLGVDEGRKRVILIAALILTARRLKHENELMVMKIDRLED